MYCQRPFSSTFDADKARQTAADALKLVNKGKDTEKPENTNVSAAESTTTSEPQASIAPETRDMYTSARPSTSGESVQRDSASRSASASDTFDDGDDEDDGEEERRVSKEELIEEMIRASHAAEVAALSFQQGQVYNVFPFFVVHHLPSVYTSCHIANNFITQRVEIRTLQFVCIQLLT